MKNKTNKTGLNEKKTRKQTKQLLENFIKLRKGGKKRKNAKQRKT